MSAIVLIEPGEAVSAELRRLVPTLGGALRETASVTDGLAAVQRAGADVEGLVVGATVQDPVQTVQQLYSLAPDAPVVVVASDGVRLSVSRALQFSPFVSSFVRCLPEDPRAVAAELERAVRDHRRRRRHKAIIAQLNAQLGATAETASQRSANEYLGRLLQIAPIGVITCDPSGVVTACNAKAAALLETSERDALGATLSQWFDGENLLASQVERVVERRRHDGSVQHLQLSVAPISSRSGAPGSLLVLHDVTRRHEVERERDQILARERAARTEAEEASRAKDEFLSVVSHELRTPLNSVLGWIQLLKSPALTAEKRERAIGIIERNARAQTQLIEDLLDVSRIISGKLRLTVEQVDPAPVVDLAIEVVRPAADAKGIRIQHTLDPDTGLVMGDPGRLQQIAWNLLSNAVKFTPRGGHVQVLLRRVDSYVELTVSDSGPGISAEFLPHVFERFRQQDSGSTRAQGGLGLGLAIARHLVELHGGTISVREGKGATFTVRLPISPVHVQRPAVPALRPAPRPSGELHCPPELAGLRVLVVEDEADAREMIATVLSGCGALVTCAGSAPEALAAFEAQPFELVISDVGMPGEDGLSLIRKLRARPPELGGRVPAVALTAYARKEDRTRALLAGFSNHVAKPVDVGELLAAAASLTSRLQP